MRIAKFLGSVSMTMEIPFLIGGFIHRPGWGLLTCHNIAFAIRYVAYDVFLTYRLQCMMYVCWLANTSTYQCG
ncbi:hypothetical protein V8C40DRAFT_233480 [Trichoderma camerunense]